MSNSFCSTLSRTKWTSASICLVRACATSFAVMQATLFLSHQITGHEELGNCSSFSKLVTRSPLLPCEPMLCIKTQCWTLQRPFAHVNSMRQF